MRYSGLIYKFHISDWAQSQLKVDFDLISFTDTCAKINEFDRICKCVYFAIHKHAFQLVSAMNLIEFKVPQIVKHLYKR